MWLSLETIMSEWKKSFIEAEQEKGSEERLGGVVPASHTIGLYVTVCLFLTATILILSTILGIVLLEGVWVVVVAGGCVGVSVMVAASVVTWLARGLANTALMQGVEGVGIGRGMEKKNKREKDRKDDACWVGTRRW
ncbi:hypothetical protein Pcinc_032614 [Petrolisthes cinctipes]|uniref:Uncharacterized protein n=1 Tax=Petrolisthes cinctipes TaxID=88211 RepID=A0AAE1EU24_PETCI|nr:hypothetical protein Pcinc_032614 [Petrolisthes cinctipes]